LEGDAFVIPWETELERIKRIHDWTIYRFLQLLLFDTYYLTLARGTVRGTFPKPPFIIAANHVSYFDWVVLDSLFWKSGQKDKVRFIAKKKLLSNPAWRVVVKFRQSIIVDDTPNRAAYKEMFKILHDGKVLCIFPDGKRTASGHIEKFQEGVARLALQSKVPVVPVGLVGFFENWTRHRNLPRPLPRRMEVRIGSPIETASFSAPPQLNVLIAFTDVVKKAIEDLLDGVGVQT